MRRFVVIALIAVVTAAVAAVPGEATGNRDALIRPGGGIGKVQLGMTPAQVTRALGRPDERQVESRGFGVRYRELTWWSGLADTFTVGIYGRAGTERVVYVGTTKLSERTAGGIGPGVPMTRVRKAFPGLRCEQTVTKGGFLKFRYVYRHENGADTVFVTGGWTGDTAHRHDGRYSAKNVAHIAVRTREGRPSNTRPC